jgi:hypothetical protein
MLKMRVLKILFYFCLLFLSLGQLTLLSSSNGLNIYLSDVSVGGFALYGLLFFIRTRGLIIPNYIKFYLLFILVAILSLLFTPISLGFAETLVSTAYLLRFITYLIAGLILFNIVWYTDMSKDILIQVLVFSGIIVALLGFIQLIVLPDLSVLGTSLGWDPHKNRLTSTFFDPNYTGAYLSVCLIFVIDRILFKQRSYSLYAAVSVLYVALVLTFSRSAGLVFIIGILVYGLLKSRRFLLVSLSIVFLTYFLVPRIGNRVGDITDTTGSAQYRISSWSRALEISKDTPFLGIGFNTYKYAQEAYGFTDPATVGERSLTGVDSSFLFVLATTGTLGLSVFFVAYFYPIYSSFKMGAPYRLLRLTVFVGLFAGAFFVNLLFYPQILFLGMLTLAITEA